MNDTQQIAHIQLALRDIRVEFDGTQEFLDLKDAESCELWLAQKLHAKLKERGSAMSSKRLDDEALAIQKYFDLIGEFSEINSEEAKRIRAKIKTIIAKHTPDMDTNGCAKVAELKRMGAKSCDGDCSVQALIPLRDGRYLRAAVTDSDVAEAQGLWFDFYGRWDGKKFEYKEQQGPMTEDEPNDQQTDV